LIPALLDAGFNVSALSRPSSTATFPSEVKVLKADYNDLPSLTTALQHQDAVVSAVGTWSVADQKTVIEAAVAAKVKRFIPSEYGGNSSLSGTKEFAPFAIDKQNIVEQLKSKEGDGLSWTAICTGAFFSWVRAFHSI
jgi:uncharacterized protein YbjT (DUF2867 family)